MFVRIRGCCDSRPPLHTSQPSHLSSFVLAVVVCLSLQNSPVQGAQSTLDSLERLLPSHENRHDSSAIRLYNELAREYFTSDAAKSLLYAQRAVSDARKLDDQTAMSEWTAQSLSNLGAAYFYLGKYDFALENHLQALRIRETLGDKRGQAISLNNVGLVYYISKR
jgi:tetratricopeptide (TPR) repeat protein